MNAAACEVEGLECPVDFDCEETFELVQCTCRSSRWSCRDPVGPLEAGESPRCKRSTAPAAEEPCPSTTRAAQGTACPAIGRTCFYEGQHCPDGTTKLDDCACKRDDAGALVYVCVQPVCGPPIETVP
jgi:hypothetical protein